MEHFLQYWRPDTVERELCLGPECHIGGEQLAVVAPGDVVWVVTIRSDRLLLVLRFPVAEHVSRQEAQKRLPGEPLWEAQHHVLSTSGHPCRAIDITALGRDLGFKGKKDRLPATYSGQHLQRLRRLTPETVSLLEREWRRPGAKSP